MIIELTRSCFLLKRTLLFTYFDFHLLFSYLRVTVGVDVLDEDSSKFKIREKTIRQLCNYQRGCRVNNLEEAATEKGLEPFNPDVIVRRARDRFNEELIENYHLLTDNCEHFATWCRYGTKFSCQVNLLILEPFIYVSRWRARRQTDHPNDMIIESVRQNEERN